MRSTRPGNWIALALLLLAALPSSGLAELLRLERVEIEGNHRTNSSRALEYLALPPGDALDPEAIEAAKQRLEESELFASVDLRAKPGSEPGQVVLVAVVTEWRPRLRIGAGYQDLSGWYLVPLGVDLWNPIGRGEQFSLAARVGYRVSGLVLSAAQPFTDESRSRFGASITAEGVERIYFDEAVEIAHHVNRGSLQLRLDSSPAPRMRLGAWITAQGVEVDSTARVYVDDPDADRDAGDKIPFNSVPPAIQRAVGQHDLARAGFSLAFDSRTGAELSLSGNHVSAQVEAVGDGEKDWGILLLDWRHYRPLQRGLLLAANTKFNATARTAPFFERPYVGGLYSVRGFPSHALSPAEGDLRTLTGSVELRAALIGRRDDPTLAGLLFTDAGLGVQDENPTWSAVDVGMGFGFRVRVPWIRWLGIDVGFPVTPRPDLDPVHVNASIGWTY